ncbi:MAG: PCI domain-containing protein [Promethearchaeota archaeon]
MFETKDHRIFRLGISYEAGEKTQKVEKKIQSFEQLEKFVETTFKRIISPNKLQVLVKNPAGALIIDGKVITEVGKEDPNLILYTKTDHYSFSLDQVTGVNFRDVGNGTKFDFEITMENGTTITFPNSRKFRWGRIVEYAKNDENDIIALNTYISAQPLVDRVTKAFEARHLQQPDILSSSDRQLSNLRDLLTSHKSVSVTQLAELLDISRDEVMDLLYDLVGSGKVLGHLDGEVFVLETETEEFMAQLETFFGSWDQSVGKKVGKKS